MLDSPVYFRECFRVIERDWASVLHPSSRAILWMIMDRTLGWGKRAERIPLRHFTDGVLSGAGEVIHPGTGLSRATVIKRLGELVGYGTVQRHGECTYTIDFEWRPENVGLRKTDYKLPSRDKSSIRGGSKKYTGGSKNETPTGIETRPHKRGQKKGGQKTRGIAARFASRRSEGGEAHETLEAIERRRVARADGRKVKARTTGGVPRAALLAHMWMDSVAACYPDAILPTLTAKKQAMLRQYAFKWCRMKGPKEQRVPFENFSRYMDWVVLEWRLLIDNRFQWCDNAPIVPDIQFYVGLANHFEQAWAERRELEAMRDMTPREAFRARLLASGKSEDAADRAVEDRFRVQDQIQELEKTRRAVERERKAAERGQEELAGARVRRDKHEELQRRRAGYRGSGDGGFEWRDEDAN